MTPYIYNKGKQEASSEPLNDSYDAFMRLPRSEQASVMQRLANLGDGVEYNIQNAKPVRPNVFELKFRGGQKDGWRIYYSKIGDDVVITAAGDKDSQDADIKAAETYRDDALKRLGQARKNGQGPEDVFREINPEEFYRSAERNSPAKSTPSKSKSNGHPETGSENSNGPRLVRDPSGKEGSRYRVTAENNHGAFNDHPSIGGNALQLDVHPDANPHNIPVNKPLMPNPNSGHAGAISPNKDNVVTMPVRPGTPMAEELALKRATATGMSGYLTYSGVTELVEGAQQFHNGDKVKGGINVGLGLTSTGIGTVGTLESIAPGIMERRLGQALGGSIVRGLENGMPLLIAAQAGVEIAIAPDGQKLNAAYRAGGTMAAFAATSALVGEGGGAWPIAAAAATGLAIDRGLTLSDMRKNHDAAMAAIKPDGNQTHLREAADQLQDTLVMAQLGDRLAKDKNGNVDIDNQKNLDAIKAILPEQTRNAIHAQSVKDTEAAINKMSVDGMAQGGMDPFMAYSEKQMKDFKDALVKSEEKEVLQRKAIEAQQAMDARKAYFPPDAKLALDASGKVALNDENLKVIGEVLKREHDSLAKGVIDTNQSHPYFNLLHGEEKLREHIVLEEQLKKIDAATVELKQLGQSAQMPDQQKLDLAVLETKAREMAKANGGKQNVEIVRIYKVGDANEPPAHEMYQEYQKQYQADPQHRTQQDIKQMVYKDDGHGHKVADKVVVWEVMDPAALQKAADAVQRVRNSGATFDGERNAPQSASSIHSTSTISGQSQQPPVPGH